MQENPGHQSPLFPGLSAGKLTVTRGESREVRRRTNFSAIKIQLAALTRSRESSCRKLCRELGARGQDLFTTVGADDSQTESLGVFDHAAGGGDSLVIDIQTLL